jgi:hypothetical protein
VIFFSAKLLNRKNIVQIVQMLDSSSMHHYWRIKVNGQVFKLFVSSGYTLADISLYYQGAEASPITEADYLT